MFLGHIAVGFAGKRVAPRTSLGTLLLAPLFLDALWPVFLVLGRERARVAPGITVVTPLEKMKFPELWAGSLSILVGGIFLVNQFVSGTLRFVLRGWPLVLIGIGVYNLNRHFRKP